MEEKPVKNVVIYTTNSWPWCHRAKEYLSNKGIKFTEHDVTSDREKAKELVQKSGQLAVPVILVDDQVVVGFNQAKLDSLLPWHLDKYFYPREKRYPVIKSQ